MTTTDEATTWVEAYREAWISNDPDAIAALFTDDAVYEFRPGDPEPWRGRDAIVSGWMEDQDSPETWTLDFHVLGTLDDGTTLVRAVTEYLDERPTFDNLWFITLDGGKASRFTEWYMAREGTGTERMAQEE
jgi:ketosteroid isomerase-like protein